jgi:hypothetical protein
MLFVGIRNFVQEFRKLPHLNLLDVSHPSSLIRCVPRDNHVTIVVIDESKINNLIPIFLDVNSDGHK